MPAFALAIKKGYGIELDLHLLSDGSLAVFHDNTLVRTTGKEGNIKDLTKEQLKDYNLEGTRFTIPTFSEVLKLVDGQVPLIIELKTENNTAQLCKATVNALQGYKGDFCIESFDPRPLIWLKKNCPDIVRGQLSQNFFKEPSGLKVPLQFILTTLLLNFLTKPDFIAYKFSERNNIFCKICKSLWKHNMVTWTITSSQNYDTAIGEDYVPIFEQIEP
jgi:glycerophosphoryl diester phosphodiesterase